MNEILKMIEEVSPDDTAKLDEIDIRTHCWLRNREWGGQIMKISFEYSTDNNGEHVLTTTSTDGLEIEIHFDGLDASYFYTTGEHEFIVKSDDYKGLYIDFGVKLQSNIVPIATVIQQANAQIQDIVMELRQEQLDYEDHVSAMMASHRYI